MRNRPLHYFYFKVHEGPINIHMHSGRRSTLTGSFEANMFFSDEPGYYENGNFGIRLETILRVVAMNLTETTYGITVGQNAKYIPISLFWYYKNLRTNVLFASKTLKIYTFKWFLNK